MAIYTRSGDKGKTSLWGGKIMSKDDLRIEVIGDVDEFNASIGVARGFLKNSKGLEDVDGLLEAIQGKLFEIGAEIAGSNKYKASSSMTDELENLIDKYEKELPSLKEFIVPSGTKESSFLHQARTICRRAERRTVQLSKKESINPELLKYLNRLSDLLFVLARYVNKKTSGEDICF